MNKTNVKKKRLSSRLMAGARAFLANTRVTIIINAKGKQEVAKDLLRTRVA